MVGRRILYICSIAVLIIISLVRILFLPKYDTGYLLLDESTYQIRLRDSTEILGTERDGVIYFCLPAHANISILDQSLSKYKVYNEDGPMTDPMFGQIQTVHIKKGIVSSDENVRICFMKSENIYSLFLDLDGEPNEGILFRERTPILASQFSPSGRSDISSMPALIQGRGNATWHSYKRPYELRFDKKVSLCGMPASKKWTLLANAYEGTKILNKIAFDLAIQLGMECVTDSDWVDLYINGEYQGNYLVCHEPTITSDVKASVDLQDINSRNIEGAVPLDLGELKGYLYASPPALIDGPYMIEKNDAYYDHKTCGFHMTDKSFTLKSPDNASIDQVVYIHDFIKTVDNSIHADTNEQLNYIDLSSFVKWHLIEEIMYNEDALVTSCFFYKNQGEQKLYAGPVWDFDCSCGESAGSYLDYTGSILDELEHRKPLDWYKILYDNPTYKKSLEEKYELYLPIFISLVDEGIDNYYTKIGASLQMDRIIWGRKAPIDDPDIIYIPGYYESVYNNFRFTKYYLYNRLLYLCKEWECDKDLPPIEIENHSIHTITFTYPDGTIVTMSAEDGSIIAPHDMPEYDSSMYSGWMYSANGLPYSSAIPIFEDTVLSLMPVSTDE